MGQFATFGSGKFKVLSEITDTGLCYVVFNQAIFVRQCSCLHSVCSQLMQSVVIVTSLKSKAFIEG